MAIVGIVNQKGGCSKSTTSVHLTYWLQSRGHLVALVDADAQRSSSIWLKGLEGVQVPVHVIQSADDILERLPSIAADYKYCIVDGPAGLSESTRAILFRADLAVVPCQPTGVDLRSAADAIKLVRQAQSVRNGPPDARVFLSRAVKGTRLKDEAIALLEKSGVPILNTVIHQRQVIADTFGQRATVFTMPGRSATDSAREFENLFTEVIQTLS
ncbi:MAG: AAA family ATPase [Cyanobacteria bacterium J06659_2]